MQVVYIIGKVSNLPRQKVVEKFHKAEMMLREAGYSVVNPVEIVPEDTTWLEAMKVCIRALTKCTHIYRLPCYITSRGGLLESKIARALELIEVKNLEDEN